MTGMLARYAPPRRPSTARAPQAGTSFIATTGLPLNPDIARATFWRLLDRAGIQASAGRPRPQLHDYADLRVMPTSV